jgi:hypothetical protein
LRTACPIPIAVATPTEARSATPTTSHASEDWIAASQMMFADRIAIAAVRVIADSSSCAARARVASFRCFAVAAAAEAHSPSATPTASPVAATPMP